MVYLYPHSLVHAHSCVPLFWLIINTWSCFTFCSCLESFLRSSQLSWFWFTFFSKMKKYVTALAIILSNGERTPRFNLLCEKNKPHDQTHNPQPTYSKGQLEELRVLRHNQRQQVVIWWKSRGIVKKVSSAPFVRWGFVFFLMWWEHSLCHGSVLQLLVSLWVVCGRMQKIPFWLEGDDHGSASLLSKRLDEDLIVIKGLRIMNTSQDLRIIAQRSVDTLLTQVTLDTHCRLLQLLTYF